MKKILFIIYGLDNLGGSERVAIGLANSLSDDNEVEVVCNYGSAPAYPLERHVKVTYFQLSSLSFLFKIKRHLRNKNYDLVLVHSMTKLTPAMMLLGVRHENIWSLEHVSYAHSGFLIRLIRKWFYHHLRGVVVLTCADSAFYKELHTNVRVIRNPSPFKREYLYSEKSNIVVSMGSLTKRKGFDRLISAWTFVEEKSKDFQLHIYGDGEERESLQRKINNLGLKNVFLKGSTRNVKEVYRTASFFAMSSHYEGLPMVLIEAQSFGLPIISFDCPSGPAEIIKDEVDGYLVANGAIESMAEKILCLINNEEKRKRFSKEAYGASRKYDEEEIVAEWKKVVDGK